MMVLTLMAAFLAADPAAEAVPGDDKVVCKRIAREETGSRLGGGGREKVCKTKAEWRLAEEETRRALRAIRDRGGVNPNNAGGRQ